MRRFIVSRNQVLTQLAESAEWSKRVRGVAANSGRSSPLQSACRVAAVAEGRQAADALKNMKAPEHFEVMEGYCCYRLSGHGLLTEAASKVMEVITFSREQGIHNLLIDTTRWTGHGSPETVERYYVAQAFAAAASSEMKLAMVVRPEMMDPDKFEVMVARKHGLVGNVFDSEKDALAWLLDPAVR